MHTDDHLLAPAPDTTAGPRRLAITFTGSGSEYFRIWLVNTLLTLVTLTLYAPFAKVRRLRWQYANTLVDGQPLAFHGDPWKMLRGHVLLLVFTGLYLGAGQVSPLAGVVAGGLLAALWPALWQASLRFRLANSSWRGVRFAFTGSVGGAYTALAPMLLPAAGVLGLLAWPEAGTTPDAADTPALAWLLGLAPLAAGLLWPWVSWRARRYQHSHYHWAGQTTGFDARLSAFYGLSLRAGAVTVLPIALVGVVAALVLGALGQQQGSGWPRSMGWLGLLPLLLGVGYLAVVFLAQAYLVSRQQNLVWNHTRSAALQFHSALAMARLWPRLAKNMVFSALTLGLYWPFGWVKLLALRLQAVHIDSTEDPARWVATHQASEGSAAGEAAGDLLDVDIGL